MTNDSGGEKESSGLKHSLLCEKKKVEPEGRAESGDGESRADKIVEDVKDGGGWALQVLAVQQVPPQQHQGTVDCWERFLHLRSIKVLLVENDDSTRHVVTALLRNCNYEVIEAANGIQAWKILEDLTNHIDLVLTEVVMPCLSGIALLSKIMSHKTRKNIPVIMMSCHGSMGLVFKCLSKGAVDFLVKPIRKNELKNLWQHVWRRCHSSSGSGSESGTQKSVKSKSSDKSDNNSGSNDGDDRSIGLNVGAGSDSGSGTQSSWTKQAAEVDSSQAVAPWDRITECPDSTCAQVIRPNIKASGNEVLSMTAKRECQEADHCDNVARDKELVIGRTRDQHINPEHPIEVLGKLIGRKQKDQSEIDFNTFTKSVDERDLNPNGESPSTKYIVDIASMSDPQTDSREFKAPKGLAKALDVKNKTTQDSKELPVVDLSLKRHREQRDAEKTVQDDYNILRHSELSAFSRYNTTSQTFKAPKENLRSGYPLAYPHQCSHGLSNNNIDMGSTTNRDVATPGVFKDKSEAMSTVNGFHQSSAFKTFETDTICSPKKALLVKADDKAAIAMLSPPGGSSQQLPMHALHDPFNHFEKNQQKPPSKQDDLSSNKLDVDVPHCGSSNVLSGPVGGNAGNYSLNRTASSSHHGSNHGSNGQNGCSTAANAGDMNMESANIVAGNSGSGDASGSGSGNNADNNKLAHREAALIKFRQKRKERCFQKKVRYQSRKRLAEQRPRVRGQFVRQSEHENSSSAADS